MQSINNSFGSQTLLINQDVNRFSSPVFDRPAMETPLLGDRWEDIVTPPFATSVGSSVTPPTIAKLKDNGLGSAGVYTWAFNEKKEEELFFSWQIPHSWKEGTDLKPHVHFCVPTQTATQITWGLEYTIQKIGGTFGNSTIISNPVTCPAPFVHTIGSLGTIPGAGLTVSCVLMCRLFRAVGGYVGPAYLLSADCHYKINTIGSTNETSK